MTFAISYFLKNSPELLERRLKWKEREREQKIITAISTLILLGGFIISGLDYRLSWSEVQTYLVVVADIFVFLGYLIVLFALKVNVYASRVVEVANGQKLISTGPYAIVRHPMYSGVVLMFLWTPLALGSFWAIISFFSFPVVIVFRILNEEKILLKDFPGYQEYYRKVRYQLIPFLWQ